MRSAVAGDVRRRASLLEHVGLVVGVVVLLVTNLRGAFDHSLWLDEAYTAAATRHLGVTLTQTRGTMPLYYVAMWAWGQVSMAPIWLRLPSIVASIAVLGLTQVVGRRFLKPAAVAVVPVVLVAVPMFQVKAVEARPYAVWTLLTVGCWYVLLRAIESENVRDRRRWLLTLTVLSVVGPMIHGLFFCQLLGVVAFALWARRPGITLRSLSPAIVVTGVVTFALALSEGDRVAGAQYVGAVLPVLSRSFLGVSTSSAVVLGVLAAVGLVGLVVDAHAGRKFAMVPVVWVVVPVGLMILTGSRGIFYPRYLAPSVPALALIGATGAGFVADALARALGDRPWRTITVTTMIVVLFGLGTVAVGSSRPPGEDLEDWRSVAAYVADHAEPGDGVVFDLWNAPDANFQQEFRVPVAVAWSELDDPPDVVSVAPPARLGDIRRVYDDPGDQWLADRAASYRRVWVVGYWESWKEGVSSTGRFQRAFEPVTVREYANHTRLTLYTRQDR